MTIIDEAGAKRLVLWRAAQEAGLRGYDLMEFYDIASEMNDPYKVKALATHFSREQRVRTQSRRSAEPKAGMVSVPILVILVPLVILIVLLLSRT